MEDVAEKAADTLQEEVGEGELVGVSYYHEDGIWHVYRSDWAEERYTPEEVDGVVDELRFESLGHVAQEARQEQSLHATIRMYDDVLDVAIPTDEMQGVAFALAVDGDYSLQEVIAAIEESVTHARAGRETL